MRHHRWLAVVLPLALYGAEAGYVAAESCRPCHASIYDSYAKTGMGRSFTAVTEAPPAFRFTHALSGQTFESVARAGGWRMRRTGLDLPPLDRSVDLIIGSGNHSRTFAHRDAAGRLFELPVSWYAEDGGVWAMSPGYDRANHSGFRRQIPDSCLFCHNGYPSEPNGGLARGIDCQRCHGPGEAHVTRQGAIVNPAKLSSQRRMEVCLQCHLESASRAIPDSIRRYDRGPYSYRPGEPLGNFTIYFDRAVPDAEDAFTVNHSAYGLFQSRCFQKSAEGKLTCVTCHNPHHAPRGEEADLQYTKACRSCHSDVHPEKTSGCAGCHMAPRRTDDAVHVMATDHHIRRKPAAGLLARKQEKHGRYEGPVKLLYPRELPDTAENRLYLAVARLNDKAHLAEGTAALARLVAELRPSHAGFYLALATAQRELNRPADAARSYREALSRDPANRDAVLGLAQVLMEYGRNTDAAAWLERATPHPDVLDSLAVAYVGSGRYTDAETALRRSLELDPESAAAWLNLGVALEAQKRKADAAGAYRRALSIQPDLTRAREFLKRVTR